MNEDRVNDVVSDATNESHAHALEQEQPELGQPDCKRECKCTQREDALEPELALTVRVFVHDKKMICGVEADYAKKGLEEKLERMALQLSSALSFDIRHFDKEIKALINADR